MAKVDVSSGFIEAVFGGAASTSNSPQLSANPYSTRTTPIDTIDAFYFQTSLPVGTTIKIYAIRA